jgi:hypothetical protein
MYIVVYLSPKEKLAFISKINFYYSIHIFLLENTKRYLKVCLLGFIIKRTLQYNLLQIFLTKRSLNSIDDNKNNKNIVF